MSEIVVSEIQIIPVNPQSGLVAFASCLINNQFYIGGIGVYTSPLSPDYFRLVYPTKVLNNGRKLNIVYPINKEIGSIVQKRIAEEYLKLMEKFTKGDVDVDRC